VDLLGLMSAIGGYEQIASDAKEIVIGSYPVKLLSLTHLIATKEAAGRPKDLAVLPLLRAALESKRQDKLPDDSAP
jgi:predicted nucleotidyltransferase